MKLRNYAAAGLQPRIYQTRTVSVLNENMTATKLNANVLKVLTEFEMNVPPGPAPFSTVDIVRKKTIGCSKLLFHMYAKNKKYYLLLYVLNERPVDRSHELSVSRYLQEF